MTSFCATRIDYLTLDLRLTFYRPDFFVRMDTGEYARVESKGRQDSDVPRKAAAAVEWCKAASKSGAKWQYVFTPQNVMERLCSNTFASDEGLPFPVVFPNARHSNLSPGVTGE